MSRPTAHLLVLMFAGAVGWLLVGCSPDPQRAAFELGTLFGLALCLAMFGGIDLLSWMHQRLELHRRSQQD